MNHTWFLNDFYDKIGNIANQHDLRSIFQKLIYIILFIIFTLSTIYKTITFDKYVNEVNKVWENLSLANQRRLLPNHGFKLRRISVGQKYKSILNVYPTNHHV